MNQNPNSNNPFGVNMTPPGPPPAPTPPQSPMPPIYSQGVPPRPPQQPPKQPIDKKKALIGTIVLLVIIILMGIGGFVLYKKYTDKPEPNKKHEVVNKTNLTIIQIEDYLKYIPDAFVNSAEYSVYVKPNTVDAIDKKALLSKALNDAFRTCNAKSNCEAKTSDYLGFENVRDADGNFAYIKVLSKNRVEELTKTMYRKDITTEPSITDFVGTYQYCYWYNQSYYIETGCNEKVERQHLGLLDTSEFDDMGNLIIYEYAAYADDPSFKGEYNIVNYTTKEETALGKSLQEVQDYFNENYTSYTKYKHKFLHQDDNTYTWYNTEIVQEIKQPTE